MLILLNLEVRLVGLLKLVWQKIKEKLNLINKGEFTDLIKLGNNF